MTQATTSAGFSLSIAIDAPADAVFAAVANPRAWWSRDIVGDTDRLGAEFAFEVPGVHRSHQRVSAFEAPRLIAWDVVDAELTFVADPAEWVGTSIRFEISPADERHCALRFTHVGLTPDVECYDACSTAWRSYVTTSIRRLAETGTGAPDQEDDGPLEPLARDARAQ